MALRKPGALSQNLELIREIGKHSRSKMYHKHGIWAIKAKHGGVLPRHEPKAAPPMPAEKPPKYYLADDVKQPIPNLRKPSSGKPKGILYLSKRSI